MSKIPEGFATLTPSLAVNGAAKAIELYTKALGAKELYRMEMPDNAKIMHACLEIGTSKIFLSDTDPHMCANPTSSTFYVYMENVDNAFKKATQAGMKELFPVTDMFWGDRMGSVEDPFGNRWSIATKVRDVSQEEMEEARRKFFNKAA